MVTEEHAPPAGLQFLLAAGLLLGWLLNLRYMPWPSFYADAGLSAAWMAALLVLLFRAPGASRRPPFLIPFGVLAPGLGMLLVSLQLAFGQIVWAGDAWLPMVFMAGFGLAQTLGANLPSDSRQPDRWEVLLARTCVAAALLSTALAFMQWFGLTWIGLWLFEVPAHGRPGANLAQANHLAMLMLWALASLDYLHAAARATARQALAAALVLAMGLALTESRFIWLAMAAWLWAEWRRHGWQVLRKRMPGHALLLAVYTATYMGFQYLGIAYAVDGSIGARMASTGRLQIWAQMMDAIGTHPWAGWGWNQVVVAQYQSASSAGDFAFRYATNAHSLLLDLALWCGVPLALLIAGATLRWFWSIGLGGTRQSSQYLWLCLLMLFIHALMEFPY